MTTPTSPAALRALAEAADQAIAWGNGSHRYLAAKRDLAAAADPEFVKKVADLWEAAVVAEHTLRTFGLGVRLIGARHGLDDALAALSDGGGAG